MPHSAFPITFPSPAQPDRSAPALRATSADPIERYRKLADFCRQQNLATETDFYDRSIKTLTEADAQD